MITLTDSDRARYEWQLDIPGFGERGQSKLKGASVLVSRCGGLGSVVAYELAAAGVGKLILCHAGNVRPGDLNRQLLMTNDWVGKPRIESVVRRLSEFNPEIELVGKAENITADNAEELVAQADLIVDCAPLFQERFLMNHEAVRRRIPLVECAMYGMEGQVTTIVPGMTPCLRCLHPEVPPSWKRRFPVFGAVSGMLGCLGALEAIKVLSGIGTPLLGTLLLVDTLDMKMRRLSVHRRQGCPECGEFDAKAPRGTDGSVQAAESTNIEARGKASTEPPV